VGIAAYLLSENIMELKYYSFNKYLRDKFSQRVHRISLDAGFTCPNIDGTLSNDGCDYCNNKAFSVYAETRKPLDAQIKESIKYYSKRFSAEKFIAYFQAYSGTYAEIGRLKEVYDVIKKFPQIIGLFISTRPDCVDKNKIELISSYQDKFLVWIEYGLQTTHNDILESINRGHTYEDFLDAIRLTREYDINVGVHMIVGLPGVDYEMLMCDAKRIASLDVQGIKIHSLHVLRNTRLQEKYLSGEVKLLSRDEYVHSVCDYLEVLPKDMVILRLAATALDKYLVAPLWINDKHKVLEAVQNEFIKRKTYQGSFYESSCQPG